MKSSKQTERPYTNQTVHARAWLGRIAVPVCGSGQRLGEGPPILPTMTPHIAKVTCQRCIAKIGAVPA